MGIMVLEEKTKDNRDNKELIFITFDELFIKSEQVRRKLVDKFLENLKLVNIKPLKIERARIYFDKKYYSSLKKIFGIKKIKFAYLFNNLDELKDFLSNFNFQGSFKFEVKRIDKSFPKTSLEVAREIGSFLESKGFKADLKNPENKFGIEIHKDKILFIYKEEKGLGGFPLGSQGKTISLFSGGIDSPVSSFLIAKRGIKPYYLFISNGNPIVEFKVWLVFNKINQYTFSKLFIYRIDLKEKVKEIKRGYKQIMVKVLMYKTAEKLANKLDLESFTTGEVLSQVSTQTIKSLYLLDKETSKLVLRPLLSFDKDEIKKIAKEIGTLELSELIDELCTVEKNSIPFPNEEIFKEEIKKLNLNVEDNFIEVNEKFVNNLIKKIELFEKLKKEKRIIPLEETKKLNEQELKELNNAIIYCKTGALAWEFINKNKLNNNVFACSEKDLKVNFLELLKN